MFIAFIIIVILLGGFVLLLRQAVVQRIHFCSHCGQGVYGLAQQSCCCAAGHHLSVPAG
ncbi:Uncharacterised protein [Escherichia coli]|uniref:Uncharacterized protein n=1 Tax=Escherichia coli TaxID=562 RepID=A0A377HHH6_ECOLX|nr:Uncharacterised protein [Escherichia coli]